MLIDREIYELEQRLIQRRLRVELLARVAGRRMVPVGIFGAAALGFVAVAGIMRRPRYMERRSKGGLIGTLTGFAMTLGLQFARAQLGSPMQIAQRVATFFKRKSPHGDIRQAQSRAPFSG